MPNPKFDHSDPKYAIPGIEDAPPALLEACGGFNPEYFYERYKVILALKSEISARELVERYLDLVATRMLNPHPYFNEARYRGLNPDVDQAVNLGQVKSGYHHWLIQGCHENRKGREDPQAHATFEMEEYLAAKRLASTENVSTNQQIAKDGEAPPTSPPASGASVAGENAAEEWTEEISQPASDWNLSSATPEEHRAAELLRRSGAFDVDWYLRRHPDIASAGVDPVLHYVQFGYREGRIVHPFFSSAFYVSQFADAGKPGVIPFAHYIQFGARLGVSPHPAFNPSAYCRAHGIDPLITNPLGHYSRAADAAKTLSAEDFDPNFYLLENPDLVALGVDPLEHFLHNGVYEGRRPSAHFDTRYYYKTHLADDYSQNAFLHWLQVGRAAGLQTQPDPVGRPTIAREVARFTSPGPMFEALDTSIAEGRRKRAKLFAFYLPQFHAFPENNEWWGEGFTEWRNLQRGLPRFVGHYQPRIPRDLGFYSLDNPSVLRSQAELARKMGITGFAFYFYWFNRKRLMAEPVEAFLRDSSIDMPFYLIWANENWSRRWDGAEADVLIRQDCRPEDDAALIDCFQRHFVDPRYLRIDGRPFLLIYRADAIPDCKGTLNRWRDLFRLRHGSDPLIFMAQTFSNQDPYVWGFDGAVEFPPHKVVSRVKSVRDQVEMLDFDYRGLIVDYNDVARASLSEPAPNYPLIKTVYPSWDNNARRPTGGQATVNSTPANYQAWLEGAISHAETYPVHGQSIVMINAWNEWAEAAYLEPDVHFGSAYLNATARAVTSEETRFTGEKFKIVLVGHDAYQHGAQLNLLHMASMMKRRFGCDVVVVLLSGGPMLGQYEAVTTTILTTARESIEVFARLASQGFQRVILNTVVTGNLAPLLKELGFHIVSLVHELPRLLADYSLHSHAQSIAEFADIAVFAAQSVAKGFSEFASAPRLGVRIRPQGVYQPFEFDIASRDDVRRELGLPPDVKIVLNVGFGDLRKGIDKFCQTAAAMAECRKDVAFVWAGELHADAMRWIAPDALRSDGEPAVIFLGQRKDVSRLMSAADAFYLSSREDPFPSVVLEALQVGLPVLANAGSGGMDELFLKHPRAGRLVDPGNVAATVSQLSEILDDVDAFASGNADYRRNLVAREFSFSDYVFSLLKLSTPSLKKVSAVIPNYNYAPYVAARIRSVFDQTYPIYEIIILDDASRDDSRSVIERVVANAGRDTTNVFSQQNSGSVYAQWQKAADLASGELLWIAEADDLASPTFIERVVAMHDDPDTLFSFSDSRSVDEDGWPVLESYKPYAAIEERHLLQSDEVFEARDFARRVLATKNLVLNGSAVLWNKSVFAGAVQAVLPMLNKLKIAGDWLLYAQACREDGLVGYVGDPLNIHRRHRTSVTSTVSPDVHVSEIRDVQEFVRSAVELEANDVSRQAEYLSEVTTQLRKAGSGQNDP